MSLAKLGETSESVEKTVYSIPVEVWVGPIAEQLETLEIVCIRSISKSERR